MAPGGTRVVVVMGLNNMKFVGVEKPTAPNPLLVGELADCHATTVPSSKAIHLVSENCGGPDAHHRVVIAANGELPSPLGEDGGRGEIAGEIGDHCGET